ncbi:MAG TPA: saccharopine dehydrogenase C-terminal domain-containing protein [bacterium]|nr:saccharopine dehydrogenase C-terminal domain-containing protein [bacterium]HPR87085.1 saccharopine dehydrogenase C-terminal domain-containing protein [bacterium]
MKKVLVLGAGLVSRPLVRYLLDQPETQVIIASRTVSKAEALIEGHPAGKAVAATVQEKEKLETLVAEADVAISLLPWIYHVQVAELCLKHKTHLVTTSYVSPAMRALDQQARDQGLLFLNEIGLDPGIDHMSAMKMIHEVAHKGGQVTSFESVCGGLPAPEADDNPWGYKFSWSPRGVLLAGRNSAHFLRDGKDMVIENRDLFRTVMIKSVKGIGWLEVYPNRDSMLYQQLYGLKEAKTIFRGTFRNPGWCETLEKVVLLGFLNDTERPEILSWSWAQLTASLIGAKPENVKAAMARHLDLPEVHNVIKRFEWLGLFSNEPVVSTPPTLIDALTALMEKKMAYRPGERDLVVLQHEFVAEYPGGKKEAITSLLVDYGIPHGDTSMARTVSLPAAVAVKLMNQGKIPLTGVHIPILPEIYEPVLDELEKMNIKFVDTYKPLA